MTFSNILCTSCKFLRLFIRFYSTSISYLLHAFTFDW
nr:MAG TPA: hypothetical protein [Caudoviricetes sp.]